jgi:NADH-quinone oxidoreductase subunit M
VGSEEYLGLGAHAPRLACFFAVFGLALVGLPGTLGFVAEDLLFHGGLTAQPLIGVALPLATALNAITVFRLYSTLFLGRRAIHAIPIADAVFRERVGLAVTVVLLVAGGLVPSVLVSLRTPSAAGLAALLAERVHVIQPNIQPNALHPVSELIYH